jgi:translation initiation factor 2B subunit (eIF-2B alpha/beta/delta family)
MAAVVTCFVRNRGDVLLTRRSGEVGTYVGRWAGVSGYVEGDPADALDDARRELREEVGLDRDDVELVRAGDPLDVDDEEGSFTVHPFLFESATRSVSTNRELAETEWTDPTALRDRETVPRLWATWRRVAPSVADVREDRTHGSAWISARALEVLRDAAAEADDWEAVATTGRALRDARPGMAAVANRVNRVFADADRTPDAVCDRAVAALAEAFDADDAAADRAVERLRDADATRLCTLSRSGTVGTALRAADPEAVLVAESRPEREGVGVAERLATETDAAVSVTTEAALPAAMRDSDVDAALVGADAVLADGSVVNKTGTTVLALAARRAGVPVYAVAARDKVRPTGDDRVADERSDPESVYDGDADVTVVAPTFEATSADLFAGVVTEDGLTDAAGVETVAAEHAENAEWDDGKEER